MQKREMLQCSDTFEKYRKTNDTFEKYRKTNDTFEKVSQN